MGGGIAPQRLYGFERAAPFGFERAAPFGFEMVEPFALYYL